MSENTRNPEDAADAARRLLEASVEKRVAAVRTIVTAANDADTARAVLNDAQNRHTKAWSDALAGGWSEKELRAAGVPRPDPSRARTPRSRRASGSEISASASTQTSAAESPDHGV